jgi:hypothetical protein
MGRFEIFRNLLKLFPTLLFEDEFIKGQYRQLAYSQHNN